MGLLWGKRDTHDLHFGWCIRRLYACFLLQVDFDFGVNSIIFKRKFDSGVK